jgi:hypothetical protein
VSALIARALAVVITATSALPETIKPDPPPQARHRHHRRRPPMRTAIASWYGENGPGACGTGAQTGLHFASLILACGARIRICHAGCVVGVMADHGPYVDGRTFDLNANLRDAIGCDDLCLVRWRRL